MPPVAVCRPLGIWACVTHPPCVARLLSSCRQYPPIMPPTCRQWPLLLLLISPPPPPPPLTLHPHCRPEMVVGWYHSHPGFGCWLSGVDINTQQSFEALNQRAVAVVVDAVQSVKGKVVIDAFRLISPQVWCGVVWGVIVGHHLCGPSRQCLLEGVGCGGCWGGTVQQQCLCTAHFALSCHPSCVCSSLPPLKLLPPPPCLLACCAYVLNRP